MTVEPTHTLKMKFSDALRAASNVLVALVHPSTDGDRVAPNSGLDRWYFNEPIYDGFQIRPQSIVFVTFINNDRLLAFDADQVVEASEGKFRIKTRGAMLCEFQIQGSTLQKFDASDLATFWSEGNEPDPFAEHNNPSTV